MSHRYSKIDRDRDRVAPLLAAGLIEAIRGGNT
jgi:hypothetical protein